MLFTSGVFAMFLAIPLAAHLITYASAARGGPGLRHDVVTAFGDRCVQLLVALAFLLYPVLCMRLLQLFHVASYDEARVMHDDTRVHLQELRRWQAGGLGYVALFVAGIPAAFFACLWREVKPCFTSRPVDVNSADAVARVAREQRVFVRYGLLFSKYKPSCWWYEVVEMPRKLLLVGSIIFVASGTVGQIVYAIAVALASVLVLTYFAPYADRRLSAVAWVCSVCTMLTLNCALLLHLGFEPTSEPANARLRDVVTRGIAFVQCAPLVAIGLLTLALLNDVRRSRRRRDPTRPELPAALRDEDPTAPKPTPLQRLLWLLTCGLCGRPRGRGHQKRLRSAGQLGGGVRVTMADAQTAVDKQRRTDARAEAEAKKRLRRSSARLARRPSNASESESDVDSMHGSDDGSEDHHDARHEHEPPRRLAVGSRVRHEARGLGTVSRHDHGHLHHHGELLVVVAFDMGKSHEYRQHAWPKLQDAAAAATTAGAGSAGVADGHAVASALEVPDRLAVGARVEHARRGPGTVSKHRHHRSERSSPAVVVTFDSGEEHAFSAHSWVKLQPIGALALPLVGAREHDQHWWHHSH